LGLRFNVGAHPLLPRHRVTRVLLEVIAEKVKGDFSCFDRGGGIKASIEVTGTIWGSTQHRSAQALVCWGGRVLLWGVDRPSLPGNTREQSREGS